MDTLNAILAKYVASDSDTSTANKLLGAAFVVVNAEGTLLSTSLGRTALSPDSPAFTPSSLVWIASMTKIVTTTCLMQLVELGTLHLDADVRATVPELGNLRILRGFHHADGKPILEDNTAPITLRHLLTHTAGLGYDLADPDLMTWSHAVGRTTTNLSYTLEGWTTPLQFAPGEGWCYGSGVDWACQLLERVTGCSLGEYMTEHVCKPLGMQDTTFHSRELEGRVVVECSFRDKQTGELSAGPLPVPVDPPVESGGAGLWTTANDHARLLQALLAASKGANSVLSKATADEMFRPQLNPQQRDSLQKLADEAHDSVVPQFEPGARVDHGLGGLINVEHAPGKRRAGSMTWMGMANGHWWVDREMGMAAVLMVNVLPMPDGVVLSLYDELERVLYGEVLPGLGLRGRNGC